MDTIYAKELVIKAGLELVNSGLISRTWGNVSCRLDDHYFVVTPSGMDYKKLTHEEIVQVKIDDESYSGKIKPSSEKSMHASVYRLFPNINFVIHTHQMYASILSAVGLDSIDLGTEYKKLGKKIICAKYALSGTKAISNYAIEALQQSKGNAILLRNHGALCVGEDYVDAFRTVYQLEEACENFLLDKKTESGEEKFEIKIIDDSEILQSLYPYDGCFLFNKSPEVIRFSQTEKELRPFLDDFAQIVGPKAVTVDKDINQIVKALKSSPAVFIKNIGALCWGKDKDEALAVNMITEKNCKSFFAAKLFGKPKPINPIECRYMRVNYVKRYSKLAET
jgi:L-ribulose-5-phosphate 4-epimerase